MRNNSFLHFFLLLPTKPRPSTVHFFRWAPNSKNRLLSSSKKSTSQNCSPTVLPPCRSAFRHPRFKSEANQRRLKWTKLCSTICASRIWQASCWSVRWVHSEKCWMWCLRSRHHSPTTTGFYWASSLLRRASLYACFFFLLMNLFFLNLVNILRFFIFFKFALILYGYL